MFKLVCKINATAVVLLAFCTAMANENFTNHIVFGDTTNQISINAQLVDSIVVTNFNNSPTHYDNSASVRLFLNGFFTKRFSFDARVKVSTDYTNRYIAENFYNPNEGIPYNKQSDNKRTWDIFAANAAIDLDFAKVLVGFDYLKIGPSRRNNVILRGESNIYRPWQDSSSRIYDAAPTPYFGYHFEIGPIAYTQYGMRLFERKGYGKYMHVHRLDLSLPKSITFGLSETSLYGSTIETEPNPNPDADSANRNFEWAYMIPFVPYVFEEHLMGDRDNISLAFDLSVRTLKNWEFYGELLWDDMKSPTSMFDNDWWGNKWALTIGIARDSLHVNGTICSWFVEYTHIEPWVYTHHKGGGYTYENYSQSLGSDLGPNSQEIYTEFSTAYKFKSGLAKGGILKSILHASAVAKDTAFGGNINDIHTPESRTDKKFLNSPTTINYVELGANLEFKPFDWITLRASYDRYFGDYKGYRASAVGSLQY